MLEFPRFLCGCPNDDAKERVVLMLYIASRQKEPVVFLGFCCSEKAVPPEFAMQQIRQALRACMADRAYGSTNDRIKKLITFLAWDPMVAITLLNVNCFLQLIEKSNRNMTENSFVNMTTAKYYRGLLILSLRVGLQRRATYGDGEWASGRLRMYADMLLCASLAQRPGRSS